jgi:hypothetical protein
VKMEEPRTQLTRELESSGAPLTEWFIASPLSKLALFCGHF